jgi:HTH-type transcriptional regulator/antitoxin HigA
MTKIKNDYQLAASKNWLKKFEEALDSAKRNSKDVPPRIRQAQVDGIRSQIQDLVSEIEEYETIKAMPPERMKVESLEALPEALIQLRIARDLTQADLAAKLGIKPQQIQKWEASCYERAAYASILKVAKALGIQMEGLVTD